MRAGRNEKCPCGSGKKYKKCCLNKEELEKENLRVLVKELDTLDELSSSVGDLVNEGKLEEAESICYRLQQEYPDQVDWLDRLALVYEARGNYRKAAKYYQEAAEFAKKNIDQGFDEESVAFFKTHAKRMLAKIH